MGYRHTQPRWTVIRLIYTIAFAIYIVFLAFINEDILVSVVLFFGKSWQMELWLAYMVFIFVGVGGTLVGGLIDHFQQARENKALRKQLDAQTEELASLREMVTMERDPE
jgi:uncharacterized integral membrane protein